MGLAYTVVNEAAMPILSLTTVVERKILIRAKGPSITAIDIMDQRISNLHPTSIVASEDITL
jgi:hypothetical protein